jgi:hypothetical protein
MAIRPDDRPRSIAAWLELFSEPEVAAPRTSADGDDDDATRFVTFDALSRNFTPVAPLPPGFERVENIDTPVPDDIGDAMFKEAGETTIAGIKAGGAPDDLPPEPPAEAKAVYLVPPAPQGGAFAQASMSSRLQLILAGAVAAAAGVGIFNGWHVLKNGLTGQPTREAEKVLIAGPAAATASAVPVVVASDIPVAGDIAATLQALVGEAHKAGAPEEATNMLANAASQGGKGDIAGTAKVAGSRFAGALAGDVEHRTQRIGRDIPWADPRRSNAAAGESADRKAIHARLQQARTGLGASASAAGQAADPGQAVVYARQALENWRAFALAQARAYVSGTPSIAAAAVAPADEAATPAAKEATVVPASGAAGTSAGKAGQLATIVSSGREIADRVIRMGRTSQPGSSASKKEKDNYRTLQQNVKSAQGYITYLGTLTNSLRGAKDERDADRLIAQGEQTKRYLLLLLSRSTAASQ